MPLIPDDPVISCIERTGYPPWFFYKSDDEEDDEWEDEADDVYYGNETSAF